MVQLKVLSGKMAGTSVVTRRFPFRVGRSPTADLRLDEPGVWDQHLELGFERSQGYILRAEDEALVTVNGKPVQSTVLRNGDVVTMGSAKVQFWLGEARQVGLQTREVFTWITIAAVCLGQVALVYLLLRL